MANYLAQVTLFPTSNLQADASVNTFSFSAVDDTDLPDIATALETQYNGIVTRLSSLIRQDDHLIKIYDRADAEPRAPRYEGTFDLSVAPAGNPMPTEVALCLSFQASPVSGIPQARRRGRVYFGPLDVDQLDPTGRPTSSCVTDIKDFGQGLLDASDAAVDWEWCVWSNVTPGPSIVTNGWCDNEFDTQRRRGRDATNRQVFS